MLDSAAGTEKLDAGRRVVNAAGLGVTEPTEADISLSRGSEVVEGISTEDDAATMCVTVKVTVGRQDTRIAFVSSFLR